jgi:heme exporter protein D
MFGKHAAYILPSYAITALVIFGLIVWIVSVYCKQRREIADLEARGITRANTKTSRTSGVNS